MIGRCVSNCAIFGGVGLTEQQVASGLAAMGRGDDGRTVARFGQVVLGHRRHRVLTDGKPGVAVDRSDQPYVSADGRVALVFNGEVYSHDRLRARYSDHRFESQGDSETLLAAYLHDGAGWMTDPAVDAMFAVAVWDSRRDTLVVGRDWPGRVPLFYVATPDMFVFSSQMSGLLTHPAIRVEAIRELRPGHRLELEPRTMRLQEWARVARPREVSASGVAPADLGSHLLQLLDGACERRLMGDRLPCLFFSGGLDSLLVALSTLAMARRAGITDTFNCYVYAVEGARSEDVRRARLAARHLDPLGLELHEVRTTPARIVEATPDMIRRFEPIRPRAVSFYPLAVYYFLAPVMAAQEHRSALGGDGPDELLGAYDAWKEVDMEHTEMSAHAARRALIDDMHDAILKRGSIMMMERGPVEMRFPFLESRTAEFLLSVPPEWLVAGPDTAALVSGRLRRCRPFADPALGASFESFLSSPDESPDHAHEWGKLFWKLPLLLAALQRCAELGLPPDPVLSPKLRSQHGAGLTDLEGQIMSRYAHLGANDDAELFQTIWRLLFEEGRSPAEIAGGST